MNKSKIRSYILLHIIIFVYSMSSILSKKAALAEFLSMRFIIFYGLVLVCMGVYAIVWQQVIKNLPLNAAFANKSETVIWGMIWGSLFFHETITPKMALGALIVIAGVIMVITGGEKEEKENTQQ